MGLKKNNLTKAFDCINHEILINELSKYNVSCNNLIYQTEINLSQLMANLLENLLLTVGALLGPLLFIISINDLPNNIDVVFCVYADDTSFSMHGLDFTEVFNNYNIYKLQTLEEC